MVLYFVYDKGRKTYSLPQLADNLVVVKQALIEMNPENLKDLVVIPIEEILSPADLASLRIDMTLSDEIEDHLHEDNGSISF